MVPCSMEVGITHGGAEGCSADKMGDGAAFWKGAVVECMLGELQVAFHFIADEIVVCALVQQSSICSLVEITFFVPVLHLQCGFDGLQCDTESLVCANNVGSGHAECMG